MRCTLLPFDSDHHLRKSMTSVVLATTESSVCNAEPSGQLPTGGISRGLGVANALGSRRCPRLQSFDPTEHPFSPSECYLVLGSRYSLGLFPLRGQPARPLGLRPPLLYLRFASDPRRIVFESRATGYRTNRAWDELRELTLPP